MKVPLRQHPSLFVFHSIHYILLFVFSAGSYSFIQFSLNEKMNTYSFFRDKRGLTLLASPHIVYRKQRLLCIGSKEISERLQ